MNRSSLHFPHISMPITMKRHQAMRQLADRHGHRALVAFGPGRPPQHRHAVAVAAGSRQAQADGHGGPKATKGRRIAAGIRRTKNHWAIQGGSLDYFHKPIYAKKWKKIPRFFGGIISVSRQFFRTPKKPSSIVVRQTLGFHQYLDPVKYHLWLSCFWKGRGDQSATSQFAIPKARNSGGPKSW